MPAPSPAPPLIDGPATTGSLRTLGTGALQACAGNDPRLGSATGNILPAARKARTWELFCATYGEIAREAEDDFQSVFGREFARAYDAQMRKL